MTPLRTIEIQRDEHAFRCLRQGWPATAEEKAEWQRVIAVIVQYAFASRAATAITIDPASWSIGHELPSPRVIEAPRRRYLVNAIANCTPEVLASIAGSEDFHRGLLWLSGESDMNDEQVTVIVAEIDSFAQHPRSTYEVLLVLDDARSVHWLRPERDPSPLVMKFGNRDEERL